MALEKLEIERFKDAGYSQSAGGKFTVMINPEEYSRTYEIVYSKQQGIGSSAAPMRYTRSKPETFTLNFMLDGTGVVNGKKTSDVLNKLKGFRDVAYEYNGDIHSPNYLKLSWGTLVFKGRLTKYNVKYTLFKPDGTPIRAKVEATFNEALDPATIASQEKKSSPDMTHVRTVVAGDTLPHMCFKIYNDASKYLQVAKYNKLNKFRNLEPGMQIVFPPIV